jgi:23S rRNA (adenine2503-C2)-methyltransferase
VQFLPHSLAALEPRREHASAVIATWLSGQAVTRARPPRARPFPRRIDTGLAEVEAELARVGRVAAEELSGDGSRRLVVELADGRRVESVLLARGALCVSTQVGCAVRCRFCKSGESGLERQLTCLEILAQVALARRVQPVRKVVLMGIGEPLHNFEAVLDALACLGGEGQLAHKQIVLSTVGERSAFERLARHAVRPALALSLHTLKPDLRAELLPRASRVDPSELALAACDYSDRVTWPLQVQWTLLAGVNDGDEDVEELLALFRGRRAIVNFIPWNEVEGFPYAAPPIERTVAMVRALKRGGVRATIRRSGGQDVDGACGQLRARHARAT